MGCASIMSRRIVSVEGAAFHPGGCEGAGGAADPRVDGSEGRTRRGPDERGASGPDEADGAGRLGGGGGRDDSKTCVLSSSSSQSSGSATMSGAAALRCPSGVV